MKTETLEKWQDLIQQQSMSELPITHFCKLKKISPTCFYKYKRQLKTNAQVRAKKAFIKVQSPETSNVTDVIKIQYQQTTLSLPSNLEAVWIANLLKALGRFIKGHTRVRAF